MDPVSQIIEHWGMRFARSGTPDKNAQELGGSSFINGTHDLRGVPFRGPKFAV
jgi:hypothetical protein